MDLNIYIPNIENISLNEFKEFFENNFFSNIELHPQINLKEDSGFIPFKYIKDGKEYVTGFEYYLSEFNFNDFYNEAMEDSPKEKLSLFSIFKKKKVKYAVNELIDSKLSKCNYDILLTFSGVDIFEPRITYAFAMYLIKYCQGVLYNTYDGVYYTSDSLKTLYNNMEYEEKCGAESGAIYHLFEGWN